MQIPNTAQDMYSIAQKIQAAPTGIEPIITEVFHRLARGLNYMTYGLSSIEKMVPCGDSTSQLKHPLNLCHY